MKVPPTAAEPERRTCEGGGRGGGARGDAERLREGVGTKSALT